MSERGTHRAALLRRRACPDTPTTPTPRLSSALEVLACRSSSEGRAGLCGVPVHCIALSHASRLIRGWDIE